jgi:tRNA nucleotidyltransferase (CCA-adding enzyme)
VNTKPLLNTARDRAIPSLEEKKDMKKFVKLLLSSTSKSYRPIICGSVGKSTWLSHRREADLFLIFPPNMTKAQLEKRGLAEAKKIVKKLGGTWKLAYSEHPYIQALFKFAGKTYEVDLVPAFGIRDPSAIKSAVDRTPYHVKFILKNLKKPEDVVLLKQFCIAHECYGADLKVLGFSGYLCELLIVKYGSFLGCIRAASKWKSGVRLSLSKSTKKFDTPLTFIDPVDPKRNVAAVVSPEKFTSFVSACRKFISKPSINDFFPAPVKPITLEELKKKLKKQNTSLLTIKFSKPKVLEDILWAQMRKALRILSSRIETAGFQVLRTSSFMDKKHIILIFEMTSTLASKTKKKYGPYVKSKSAHFFLKHYSKVAFIEKKRWVVETKREFTNLDKFLKNYLHITPKKLRLRGIPSKLLSMNRAKIEIFPKQKISNSTDFFVHMKKFFHH